MEEMNPKKNYGFIKPKYNEDDYVFGDGQLTAEILQEDGQWDDYLPAYECQRNNYMDSFHCWVYGTLNCLETLEKRKYNYNKNYSERYIGVLGEGSPRGGQPVKASEAIRTNGVIPETSLPFLSTIKTFWEYSSPRPMTEKYLAEGRKWLEEYSYGYDYVKTTYGVWLWRVIKGFIRKTNPNRAGGTWQDIVVDALKYSPLGVSVCAWKYRNGMVYKNSWDADNHWVELYGFEYGKYWKLYDHYNECYKKAEWNYPFGFIMRYSVYKNNPNTNPMTTIKVKSRPEIYVASESNPNELMWVGGWASYKKGLDNGWLLPYKVVEDLSDYKIVEGVWGIIS